LTSNNPVYSLVVPVFNSEQIVAKTVDRIVDTFTENQLDFELILVNDGSTDRSWQIISDKARSTPHVVAVNLLRNYGQHHANVAGFREAQGNWVITLDDDLQNPPEEALKLIEHAKQGDHDVVFGAFETKQAAGYRRLGSRLISSINRRVFGQPKDLMVSNYRLIRKDVVERICADNTAHPYVTGQSLMYSNNPSHVAVRHNRREVGHSNYSARRILSLVFTILFSYSQYPLRLAAMLGFGVALLSFVLGGFYLIRGLITETVVPGWTSLAVLLAIFNGFILAMLSMLGEYVVRTLNAVSAQQSYHVMERVSASSKVSAT
jgi:polyisoprenyl-phosphate glycosyltransferase